MPVKQILMLVGDYVEDYEVMVPFQALQMVGPRLAQQIPRPARHSNHPLTQWKPAQKRLLIQSTDGARKKTPAGIKPAGVSIIRSCQDNTSILTTASASFAR